MTIKSNPIHIRWVAFLFIPVSQAVFLFRVSWEISRE